MTLGNMAFLAVVTIVFLMIVGTILKEEDGK